MVLRARLSPVGESCAVAAGLAVVALTLGWRGGDWPAQLYRVDLFRRAGFTLWDNFWYGGHHAPGYSVLYPAVAATFGIALTAVLSVVVATWCFAVLARGRLPAARAASMIFAAGTVTNIAVGRLTFALGVAFGMAAVLAMAGDRRVLAVVLGVLTVLASPVAGVFVMLAAMAWAFAAARWSLWVVAASGLVLAIVGLGFPEGGSFPFGVDAFAVVAVVGVAGVVLLPFRAVRVGALLYVIAAAVTVVVPNALGANIARLGMYTAAPLAVGALWPARRRVAALLVGPLLAWQWMPAADGIFTAGRDLSSDPAYYTGLLAELDRRSPDRIEIPFTKHHWETTYVAGRFALARGWERQLDIGTNPIFYDNTLTGSTYRAWLDENAVEYVALPDTSLDDSSVVEGSLLRDGLAGLEPVWHDEHWQLWRVTTAKPLVEGSAQLVDLGVDEFTVRVDEPGDVIVRIHYSSHWDVDGPGCAVPTVDNWTRVHFSSPGTWRVHQVLAHWGGGLDCL